jgi:hypothetical protein
MATIHQTLYIDLNAEDVASSLRYELNNGNQKPMSTLVLGDTVNLDVVPLEGGIISSLADNAGDYTVKVGIGDINGTYAYVDTFYASASYGWTGSLRLNNVALANFLDGYKEREASFVVAVYESATPSASLHTLLHCPVTVLNEVISNTYDTGSIAGYWTKTEADNRYIKLGENVSGSFWLINANNVYLANETYSVGIGTTAPTEKLDVSGNAYISNNLEVDGTITGMVYGTSSWATNAVTASHALRAVTASFVASTPTASFALTASFIATASFARTASLAFTSEHSLTATYATAALSSDTSTTASYALSVDTASYSANSNYALTASRLGLDSGYIHTTSNQVNINGTVSIAGGGLTIEPTADCLTNLNVDSTTAATLALANSCLIGFYNVGTGGTILLENDYTADGSQINILNNATNGYISIVNNFGNVDITGTKVNVSTLSATGSLLGSASFATTASYFNQKWLNTGSLYPITASHSERAIVSVTSTSSSFASSSISSSFAATASYFNQIWLNTGSTYPITSSNAVTSAFATNAANANTSSWATNAVGFTGNGTSNYVARWTGTGTLSTSQIFDNGTTVGIGTGTPASNTKLSVENFATNSSYHVTLVTKPTILYTTTPQTSYAIALNANVGSSTVSQSVTQNGYLMAGDFTGLITNTNHRGRLENLYCQRNQLGLYYVSGSIGTARGILIQPYAIGGTIDTMYGLEIQSPNISLGGAVTTNYAIYASSTGTNYFQGSVGIGTATPLHKLQVGGGSGVSNTLCISAGGSGTASGSLRMGTTTRDWELKAYPSAQSYRMGLDYIGTNAPLSDVMSFRVDGKIGFGIASPRGFVHIKGRNPAETPSHPNILAVSDSDDDTKYLSLGYTSSLDAGVIVAVDAGAAWKPVIISPQNKVALGTPTSSTFTVTAGGNTGPSADNSYDLGSSTFRWRQMYGTASYALTASYSLTTTVTSSQVTVLSASWATSSLSSSLARTASYALLAANVISFDGYSSADFLNASNLNAGYVLPARLTGSYDINVSTADVASDAETLDGLDSTHFTNASNLSTGTISSDRLSGTYSITASKATNADNADALNGWDYSYFINASNLSTGTVSSDRLSGTYSITASVATNASNANLLDSLDSTHFLNASNLSSGVLPSGRLTGSYSVTASWANNLNKNYVAEITAANANIQITNGAGVGVTTDIALRNQITINGITASLNGTATFASNAALLNNYNENDFFNASLINTGTLNADRLSGTYAITASKASSVTPNSVALGTDTTGNYVKSLNVDTSDFNLVNGTGEGSEPTISLASQITVTGITASLNGTAAYANNANQLDGLDSTHFTNATNLSSGVIPKARLTGSYNITVDYAYDVYGGYVQSFNGRQTAVTLLESDITTALGNTAARAVVQNNNADVLTLAYTAGKLTSSINQASSTTKGFLSDTDWNTFNNKQAALVTGGTYPITASGNSSGGGDIDLTGINYDTVLKVNSSGTKEVVAANITDDGTTVVVGNGYTTTENSGALSLKSITTENSGAISPTFNKWIAVKVNGVDGYIPFYVA